MWLIDVDTLHLEEFYEPAPKYAILSHRWGGEEINFQQWQTWLVQVKRRQARSQAMSLLSQAQQDLVRQFQQALGLDDADAFATEIEEKAGYKKIIAACEMARGFNLRYLWADTICIDKTSSAELSEAINSMFRYYQQSSKCFVYLEDVRNENGDPWTDGSPALTEFRNSTWFTRGWTLQELIAPTWRRLVFFTRSWKEIRCSQNDHDFRELLKLLVSGITGIAMVHIDYGPLYLAEASVAEKMSWVSNRVTSRIEDIAYCLLGIFRIRMPLLYGEGTSAFLRLQEEIIKISTDQSIFAWNYLPRRGIAEPAEPGLPLLRFKYLESLSPLASAPSVLAIDPINFYASARFMSRTRSRYSMTNAGLSISWKAGLTLWARSSGSKQYCLVVLDCVVRDSQDSVCLILGYNMSNIFHNPDTARMELVRKRCVGSLLILSGHQLEQETYQFAETELSLCRIVAQSVWEEHGAPNPGLGLLPLCSTPLGHRVLPLGQFQEGSLARGTTARIFGTIDIPSDQTSVVALRFSMDLNSMGNDVQSMRSNVLVKTTPSRNGQATWQRMYGDIEAWCNEDMRQSSEPGRIDPEEWDRLLKAFDQDPGTVQSQLRVEFGGELSCPVRPTTALKLIYVMPPGAV
jgi:hypothetical protein